jgi:nitrogen regulatory protein PII
MSLFTQTSIGILGRAENVNTYVYVDSAEVDAVADYIYDYVNVSDYLFVDGKIFVVEIVNVAIAVTYTIT